MKATSQDLLVWAVRDLINGKAFLRDGFEVRASPCSTDNQPLPSGSVRVDICRSGWDHTFEPAISSHIFAFGDDIIINPLLNGTESTWSQAEFGLVIP